MIDNLNFVHVGLTSLVFDIINECLIYNIDVKLVLNGLNSFKDRMGHKHRFKAIFIILEESDNAVLVFNTL